MAHCNECNNSVFDEKWGEFKCKKFTRTVYNPTTQAEVCVDEGIFEKKKEK